MNWETHDLPSAFRSFRQYCDLIFEGPYAKKTEREKVTYLLLWIGQHGIEIYNSWGWSDERDAHKLTTVWKRFSDHIEPKVNAYLARFQFSQLKQHPAEAVDDYIARCRVAATKCKFNDVRETNTRIIEQLIIGTTHMEVREKLLEKGDALASMEEAMDIARTFETTKAHVEKYQNLSSPLPRQLFMVFAEKRTKSALAADVTTLRKDIVQRRGLPAAAVERKTTGKRCVSPNNLGREDNIPETTRVGFH